MLYISLDTLLKVFKTGSPQKLFAYDCVTLQVYAHRKCCRHATKIINYHSKAETILKLTICSQLLQNYFSPGYGRVSEVRTHYPTYVHNVKA